MGYICMCDPKGYGQFSRLLKKGYIFLHSSLKVGLFCFQKKLFFHLYLDCLSIFRFALESSSLEIHSGVQSSEQVLIQFIIQASIIDKPLTKTCDNAFYIGPNQETNYETSLKQEFDLIK